MALRKVYEILSLKRASTYVNYYCDITSTNSLLTNERQSLGLPFKELLPESAIRLAISELKIKYKKRLFDPLITLWAFLSQVLDTDKSCHNAVATIINDYIKLTDGEE
ncbi:hypothetical protein NIES4072_24260 [Nostoc commune NIES-4072]|uniref:Uncharacterized protein n=1 Tax=Nostoc commune NIES-4072 TaxID=2005467 RepID=A0A2R5FSG6_NOSCO|nr:hypothetical protein [Nostoc commune]BBD63918.1 hypothetical protein NIES4070_02600 [Nostoc commune HK-02]GBG18761.1 hypothetical protein NIES4072_24260 [Nostoc commune NIES-4072]